MNEMHRMHEQMQQKYTQYKLHVRLKKDLQPNMKCNAMQCNATIVNQNGSLNKTIDRTPTAQFNVYSGPQLIESSEGCQRPLGSGLTNLLAYLLVQAMPY
jgi:hypothetical protein